MTGSRSRWLAAASLAVVVIAHARPATAQPAAKPSASGAQAAVRAFIAAR